ncbi:hypothetical protein HZA97_01055 [Candidatus Woesearchaeota archaeon]|nr:hypothetical protein [Candidatus Woesearchaeota archaeon]
MKNNILGDKKKSSFDDNLAEVVNKIFDNLPDEENPKTKSDKETKVILSHEAWPFNLGIAKASPYVLSQNSFIKAFNMVNSRMVSAADLYDWLKGADEKAIDNLRNDLKQNALVTSTRIIYLKDSNESQIIHHFGSTLTPQQSSTVNIFYPQNNLNYFSNLEGGLNLLQNLFNTNDPDHTIRHTLNRLNDDNRDIELDIPQQWQREKLSERIGAVTISLEKHQHWKIPSEYSFAITINCQGWIDASEGYSRTVKYQ